MLVDNRPDAPVKLLPCVDHHAGQRGSLGLVHRKGGTGGQESCRFNHRIATACNIRDNPGVLGFVQPFAEDARPDVAEGLEWRRMRDRDPRAFNDTKLVPGQFGQSRLALVEQVRRHLIKRRHHAVAARTEQHPSARAKTLGAADVAIFAHEDHGLVRRYNSHTARLETVVRMNIAHAGTTRSMGCGRWHAPPGSIAIRCCTAAASTGLPWKMNVAGGRRRKPTSQRRNL